MNSLPAILRQHPWHIKAKPIEALCDPCVALWIITLGRRIHGNVGLRAGDNTEVTPEAGVSRCRSQFKRRNTQDRVDPGS